MPIILKGYGPFKGIKRMIKCTGDKKPDFIIGPNNIQFPKKIIASSSLRLPHVVKIKLTNMAYSIIDWEIDIQNADDEENAHGAFTLSQTKGQLNKTCRQMIIEAYFDPYTSGEYQ
jgi:hypothetical protein